MLTARGGNPDILGVFRHLAQSEPHSLGTLCTRQGSPLSTLAEKFSRTENFDFELPSGKDGFLATNSLLATSVILARLYGEALRGQSQLPETLAELLSGEAPTLANGSWETLWKSKTLITLYSPATRAAAVDLESKFSEAAIGNLQAVDYRNFAHGRHHWLARHHDSTGVIAFITDEVDDLAIKTLRLIPKKVPTLRIRVRNYGAPASIAAIVHAIRLVGMAGSAAGFDPGRPHVPAFGRKIYHLNAFQRNAENQITRRSASIVRKSGLTTHVLEMRGELQGWDEAYAAHVARLQRARYGGLILDYDGTLCDERRRFAPLEKSIARELSRLARSGAVIGIATGRGKSVRKTLQDALPKSLWKNFVVGYYNGGDIGDLADDSHPDGTSTLHESLTPVSEALKNDPLISALATLTYRKPQITLEPKTGERAAFLWDYLQEILYRLGSTGVIALRSSHSIDIIAPKVSKQNVVESVAARIGKGTALLCIGDCGKWPGNDFTLLRNVHSLSVDEVSLDPTRCWNLAPPGIKGVAATLDYFSHLIAEERGLRLRLPKNQKASSRR